jgi:hypothetical protein
MVINAVADRSCEEQRGMINQMLCISRRSPPCWPIRWRPQVRVKFTLRLSVYRQSVRLGANPLETHNQRFSSQNLRSWSLCNILPDQKTTFSHEYTCPFVKCTCSTYSIILKILPFALYTSPMSVQALQSTLCLSHVSYDTTAA